MAGDLRVLGLCLLTFDVGMRKRLFEFDIDFDNLLKGLKLKLSFRGHFTSCKY